MDDVKNSDIDLIDLLCIGLGIYATVLYNIGGGLFAAILWGIQHKVRRSKVFLKLVNKAGIKGIWFDLLIPNEVPEDKEAIDIKALEIKKPVTKKLSLDAPELNKQEPFWKGITQPNEVITATGDNGEIVVKTKTILDLLPHTVDFTKIPSPPDPLSVPLGFGINAAHERGWIWGNFNSTIIHGLIAGQSGSGKDSILKLWFVALTRNNSPQDVKFVILDGKGEWILPELENAQHMFYPPVGGTEVVKIVDAKTGKSTWEDKANDAIEDAMEKVFDEIAARTKLFKKYSVANIDRYREKSGMKMPYIIIFATDVLTNVPKLELLLKILVTKGRSLGIRLILSMQTSSNQPTAIRSSLGLVMAGSLQIGSQDNPVMGITVDDMIYRPSALPNPKVRPGIFVVRNGEDQWVVQYPYMPDRVFEDYIARVLPQKTPLLSLEHELYGKKK